MSIGGPELAQVRKGVAARVSRTPVVQCVLTNTTLHPDSEEIVRAECIVRFPLLPWAIPPRLAGTANGEHLPCVGSSRGRPAPSTFDSAVCPSKVHVHRRNTTRLKVKKETMPLNVRFPSCEPTSLGDTRCLGVEVRSRSREIPIVGSELGLWR